MDSPIFKLNHVIYDCSKEEMRDFEGPLDVILYLLSKNKIEIEDISISLILDQYLEWLHLRQQLDLEVASEFITMASHLMYIKTRMLLSIEDEEVQNEMDALIQSLEERRRNESYLQIQSAVKKLTPRCEFGRNIATRPPEPLKHGKVHDYDHQPSDLILAMTNIQSRSEQLLPPPVTAFEEIVRREPYSIETKAREIMARLKVHGITHFKLLFRGNRSRSEVVATFIVVLELCHACIIGLVGSESDCTVTKKQDLPKDLTL